MRALLFLNILFCANAFAEKSDGAGLAKALRLLRGGQQAEAYAMLDSIPIESAEYRVAFVEMQKIHYKDGTWDKFFGFATFYRSQLMERFFEPEALMLESLALTKHCQFEPAQKIVSILKEKAKSGRHVSKQMLAKAQAVEDLLYLQLKMPGNIQTKHVSAPVQVFSKDKQWNIPESQKAQVTAIAIKNPRALRVYVKNICEAQVL